MNKFSVIGAGQVGSALILALSQVKFKLQVVSDRSIRKARQVVKIVGQGQATNDNKTAVSPADIIFICVPDDFISLVVNNLARVDFKNKYVFHTSGACSSRLLEPLVKRGAAVASFHPVQTFAGPDPEPDIFQGIYFGIEGQPKAKQLGRKLAARLGAKTLYLSPEEKSVYHLACSMSSNFLVLLLFEVIELFRTIGLEEKETIKILVPLLNKTLQNVKKLGIERSLTGPLIRGDCQTVKSHLSITSLRPGLDKIYRSLAQESLVIGQRRGLSEDKIKALKKLLRQK
ncbi:MAG: DUF2520 domain-containing protein [Acidobacteriota bacterium]|nr:DUF2520 domain-containing protein [Acidobacteriota bacterium]MDW3228253.1 DUF2520 domain-containing protein [Acidobacteriota bacterium]